MRNPAKIETGLFPLTPKDERYAIPPLSYLLIVFYPESPFRIRGFNCEDVKGLGALVMESLQIGNVQELVTGIPFPEIVTGPHDLDTSTLNGRQLAKVGLKNTGNDPLYLRNLQARGPKIVGEPLYSEPLRYVAERRAHVITLTVCSGP